jgi:hypothetical protein
LTRSEPWDTFVVRCSVGAREQNRTADLFITSDLALNAVLTPENPTISAVLDVRCAQSYLLWFAPIQSTPEGYPKSENQRHKRYRGMRMRRGVAGDMGHLSPPMRPGMLVPRQLRRRDAIRSLCDEESCSDCEEADGNADECHRVAASGGEGFRPCRAGEEF